MKETVECALGRWGLKGATCRLVAARENAVHEVSTEAVHYAMRLHRRGYRTDAELRSELAWMAAVARGGLSVPAPVPALDGSVLHHIDGVQIDVLTWLTGQTMTEALAGTSPQARAKLFYALGQDMARFHLVCDAWAIPDGFARAHWDRDGLLGEAPLWDRFWLNPGLSESDRELCLWFRQFASDRLDRAGQSLDYGLIHADLVAENVLVDGANLRFIDFDDGGFGFRLFDVATALIKHRPADDYPQLQTSLITGYNSVRPLDMADLDLFLALRAATYVGWNISRMNEPGGTERNGRFISAFRGLATLVLERHQSPGLAGR